ncbi:hypothetical protein BJ508DRAFT_412584 [Ascobolus immersus RN42]|uniref:Uncharacterized protein n=1 Tax=Ascobolus immersus RN42 TaxID=1160509 RepID=A0A3N4IED5_ASCIM|nr:hypothetical protein BJ508DRAFT_412584 [Ascobolus immersus RN42]
MSDKPKFQSNNPFVGQVAKAEGTSAKIPEEKLDPSQAKSPTTMKATGSIGTATASVPKAEDGSRGALEEKEPGPRKEPVRKTTGPIATLMPIGERAIRILKFKDPGLKLWNKDSPCPAWVKNTTIKMDPETVKTQNSLRQGSTLESMLTKNTPPMPYMQMLLELDKLDITEVGFLQDYLQKEKKELCPSMGNYNVRIVGIMVRLKTCALPQGLNPGGVDVGAVLAMPKYAETIFLELMSEPVGK